MLVVGKKCFLFAALLGPVLGHLYFQLEIPNGERIPHPCKPNYVWQGVGHKNQLGGGERNAFGLAFDANNKKWTPELCNQDSDGDGRTNGEELGDPDCVWKRGDQPTVLHDISHPGVCEPVDSPQCKGKVDFVNCDYDEFKCEHVENEDIFNITVRMPETPVPARETTYLCLAFEFPTDKANTYHIIATEPHLDNLNVMHHMIVYGICDVKGAPLELDQAYSCGMGGQRSGRHFTCMDMIGGWAVGLPGTCNPPEAGFLVGGDTGYRYGIIQYHWNNPQKLSDYTDSSGMVFYATPTLRPYNAGMLNIGQVRFEIPPGSDRHEEYGACSSTCTSMYMSGDIRIFTVNNHMHYLGRAQITKVLSQNGTTMEIGNDEVYSYDSPVSHAYTNGILVRPGDEITTKCVFQSTSRQQFTYYGEGTTDEMCYSFIAFYPKENFNERKCVQIYSIDQCTLDTGFVNGCNITKLLNLANPQTQELIANVQKYCTVRTCQKECLEYVRGVKQQPCFSGDTHKVVKYLARRRLQGSVTLYAALDSCDAELLNEQDGNNNNNNDDDDTSAASGLVESFLIVTFCTCSALYKMWVH